MSTRFFALLIFVTLVLPNRQALALNRLIEILSVGVTDDCGSALQNGTVTFYDAGTTTLRTVYTNFNLSTPAANPLTLDQAGRAIVYSDRRVKLLIKDAYGTTVRTIDNVGTADSDVIAAAVTATAFPAGAIIAYGGSSAPSGWLLCDGSTFVIADYAALYAVIGTSFNIGGEPGGSARLPNPARRTFVGAGGSGTATLANTIGSRGGEETHTLITAEMPSHNHALTDPGHFHSLPNVRETSLGAAAIGGAINAENNNVASTDTKTTGITLANTGGGGAHNNMQPSLVANFIIKY